MHKERQFDLNEVGWITALGRPLWQEQIPVFCRPYTVP